jgi:hypothetical protein
LYCNGVMVRLDQQEDYVSFIFKFNNQSDKA